MAFAALLDRTSRSAMRTPSEVVHDEWRKRIFGRVNEADGWWLFRSTQPKMPASPRKTSADIALVPRFRKLLLPGSKKAAGIRAHAEILSAVPQVSPMCSEQILTSTPVLDRCLTVWGT